LRLCVWVCVGGWVCVHTRRNPTSVVTYCFEHQLLLQLP